MIVIEPELPWVLVLVPSGACVESSTAPGYLRFADGSVWRRKALPEPAGTVDVLPGTKNFAPGWHRVAYYEREENDK